jgi:hypothetical protein
VASRAGLAVLALRGQRSGAVIEPQLDELVHVKAVYVTALAKDVMSSPSDPTCRDLLSSSAERVRAGVQTVELEEAPSEHRNGT